MKPTTPSNPALPCLLIVSLLMAACSGSVVSNSRGGEKDYIDSPTDVTDDDYPGPANPIDLRTVQSCEELGFEMGSPDMEIGAGQKTIDLPARANRVEISAPGRLDQADTEYVLMQDVEAPGTAFFIGASNVTLNLNARTVTYGTEEAGEEGSFGVWADTWNKNGIVIANGNIIQGSGTCVGAVSGCCCNPVRSRSGVEEVGGLYIEYHSDDTPGIANSGQIREVHHNTIVDKGYKVTNRHQGIPTISSGHSEGIFVHHNLIRGARHRAIDLKSQGTASYNEIHLNSYGANSFGVFAYKIQDFKVHHNKIYGSGVHPLGVGPIASSGARGRIYSNYFEMENTRLGDEYGNTGSSCLRITWGGDDVEVMCNTCVLRAGNQFDELGETHRSIGRGFWLGGIPEDATADIHHNHIESLNADGESMAAGIAIVSGGNNAGLLIQENSVVANHTMVLLSDSYGHSGNYPILMRNRFIRHGEHATYRTIADKLNGWSDVKAWFIDNIYENGAALTEDQIQLYFCRERGFTELIFASMVDDKVEIDYYLTEDPEKIEEGSSAEPFIDACGYKVTP